MLRSLQRFILFGAIMAASLPAPAQPRGLPLHEISGKSMPINESRAQREQPAPQPAADPVPVKTRGNQTAAPEYRAVNGPLQAACPDGGNMSGFDKQGRPFCSNGYILTREGAVASHCEYLEFRFYNANFSGCDLSGLDLRGMTLQAADFTGANLTGTDLSFADLRYARFDNAIVIDSRFENANLASSIWHDSNIRASTFRKANMISVSIWPVNSPMMIIRESSFEGIKGPLYTKPDTHWVNTICKDGSNSDFNFKAPQSCAGTGIVVGF